MVHPRDRQEFLNAAIDLARLGGRTAVERLGAAVVERKDDLSPVTDADHAVQAVILSEIARRFPDHAVYVEEVLSGATSHASPAASPFCWVVDPIDGTRNFARGMRLFATSVALLHEGRPLVGAIFDACSGSVYSATLGGGAVLDGRSIRVIDRPLGPDTTIAFSSFRRRPVPPGIRALFDTILFRNCGAACLHQAWVAAGFVDAIFAPDTKLWDIAAGALVIAEAGGVVTDVEGHPCWPANLAQPHATTRSIMAGSPSIHRLLAAESGFRSAP